MRVDFKIFIAIIFFLWLLLCVKANSIFLNPPHIPPRPPLPKCLHMEFKVQSESIFVDEPTTETIIYTDDHEFDQWDDFLDQRPCMWEDYD